MKLKNYHIARYISLFEEEDYKESLKNSLYNTEVYIDLNNNKDFPFQIYADNGYEDEISEDWFNKIIQHDLCWLSETQRNENGTSRGGFDFEKDMWCAEVISYKTGEKYNYENISHRKVAMWLKNMQEQFELN